MFCEYAKEFVNAMQKANGEMPHEDQVKLSDRCCKQNSVYQILYPDPTTMLENIDILHEDEEEDEEAGIAGVESASSGSKDVPTLPEEKFPTESSMWPMRGDNMCKQMSMGLSSFVGEVVRPAASAAAVEADAMALKLQAVIPELNAQKGSHVVLKQPLERDRGESSCISVLALVAGKYDIFTKPQAPAAKLRPEQWYQLRDIIRWIRPTEEQLHAVMVLLAIRALGKSKAIMNQLPKSQRRPERAVLYLMEFHENVVPSATRLDEDGLRRVRKALEVHETFNLAQMLQGENIPANVNQLQELIRSYAEEGMEVFRFYILLFHEWPRIRSRVSLHECNKCSSGDLRHWHAPAPDGCHSTGHLLGICSSSCSGPTFAAADRRGLRTGPPGVSEPGAGLSGLQRAPASLGQPGRKRTVVPRAALSQ